MGNLNKLLLLTLLISMGLTGCSVFKKDCNCPHFMNSYPTSGKVTYLQAQDSIQNKNFIKVGLGGTFVGVSSENPDFNAFIAPTFYFSYSFLTWSKFKVAIESNLSLRKKNEDNATTRNGFVASFPLTLEYGLPKISFYTGVGPSYVNQNITYNTGSVKNKFSGWYTDMTGGVSLGGKKLFNTFKIQPDFRFHYLKDFSFKTPDSFMLSAVLFIGG